MEDFWTQKQRDEYEKLALDALNLIQSTEEALDTVLDEEGSTSRSTSRQEGDYLEVLVLLFKVWHSMGSNYKTIVKPHPNAANWEAQQNLLFYKPPENKVELLWQTAEWAMKYLVQIGRLEWQPILDRHWVWGRGQFAGGTPSDEFLADPFSSGLRGTIYETFAEILFHLGELKILLLP